MKTAYYIKLTMVAIIFFAGCKDVNIDPDESKTNLTLLTSGNWKVVLAKSREKYRGAGGGAYTTASFGPFKEDEIRWYLSFIDKSSYGGAVEILMDKQGQVTTSDTESSYRPTKTIFDGNTWEVQHDWAGGKGIVLYKNNEAVNIATGAGYRKIVNIVPSDDGIFNNSENVGTNTVSHYHYGTGKWKANTFFAVRYTSVRYKNRTYVIYANNQTSNDGIGVASESDKLETSPSGLDYYQMNYENHLAFTPVGFILHTAQHDDNVFISMLTHQNKLQVYKINLTNFSIQNLINETAVFPYSHYINEIDPEGNLYVVETRSENGKAVYSVRKYAVGGGNEVVLKEEDLLFRTQVQGLKLFAGKLHVALLYIEDVPDSDPNDYSFHNRYHMQIIVPK